MGDIADGLRNPLFECYLYGDLLDLVNKQRADGADEIERLREALYVISTHPVEQSKQWEIGAREMQKLARLSLEEEWGGRFNNMAQALGYFLAIDEDSQSSWKYGREEAAKLARAALGKKE